MRIEVDGLDEMMGELGELGQRARGWTGSRRVLLAAVTEGYRRRRALIPHDTGALERSLTIPGAPGQYFDVRPSLDGVTLEFGSRLPQAHWQRRRIPDPDLQPVRDALIKYVVGGGGR